MLDFVLENINKDEFKIDKIIDFELVRGTDAACDGLRLNFVMQKDIDELVKAYVYDDGVLIFNGYVDTQRQKTDDKGYKIFVYARSSACLLIDNEAEPVTYNCPSSKTLYLKNAQQFGFKYDMPDVAISDYYEVQKGSSCYGVINNFVKALTGENIYVDANNVIKLMKSNQKVKIDSKCVISECKIVNRGSAISCVDYKLVGDDGYIHHIKSELLENRYISRRQKINIASLPSWQRQMIIKGKLQNSCKDYYELKLILNDFFNLNLCDEIIYNSQRLGAIDGYYVSHITYRGNQNGITTSINASKNMELGEINYVD